MSRIPGALSPCKAPAIGIDLGTWKCCVGVVRKGKVEIIENERGNKTTPSYVAFTETERLVGEDAKDQVTLNPTNTVFGVKRIIGRRFDDPNVQKFLKNVPFCLKSICGNDGIEARVRYREQIKWLPPEHLTAMLLRKMKLTAEAYLGCPVLEAVVSVPACFNSAQRQATLDAAEIAGLKVLQLLHEPTAVALAYKDQAGSVALNKTVMVMDAGGGTLQAAVASIEKGLVDVKAVSGNVQFGGSDLDQFLVDDCVAKFKCSYKIDIGKNKKALERLRVACHKAKCDLTLRPQTTVRVDSLVEDKDFKTTIHRDDFYELFRSQCCKQITEVLKDVLKGARLQSKQIDEVLVVGGSSQIPAIITELEGIFPGKSLNRCVNIDEAVAHGAALQAALLAGDHTVAYTNLSDVTPRDFYLEHANKNRDRGVVFRKNSKIPKNKVWRVSCNAIRSQTLHLLEDDAGLKRVKSCSFQFASSHWFRENRCVIAIDHNGLFQEFVLPFDKLLFVRVTPTGLTYMKAHQLAESCYQTDEQTQVERVEASMKLESTCYAIKSEVKGWQCKYKQQKFMQTYGEKCVGLITSCNKAIEWLDNNPKASKEKIANNMKVLKERFESLTGAVSSFNEINKSEVSELAQNSTKPALRRKNQSPKKDISQGAIATEVQLSRVPVHQQKVFSMTQNCKLESAISEKTLGKNNTSIEVAQLALINNQIDLPNTRSSNSITQRDDRILPAGLANRYQSPFSTEPKLPSSDDNSHPLENRKSPVSKSSPTFSHEMVVPQTGQVRVPSASCPPLKCDVTVEESARSASTAEEKLIAPKQTEITSSKPGNEISEPLAVLEESKTVDSSAGKQGKVTSVPRSDVEGSSETSTLNSKKKRGGVAAVDVAFEEVNSDTSFELDSESSHKPIADEQSSLSCDSKRAAVQTASSRHHMTANNENFGSNREATCIEQHAEASLSTTLDGSVISPNTTPSGSVVTPSIILSGSVTSRGTVPSGSARSPRTTPSGPVPNLTTTTSGSIPSPSTTTSGSVINHNATSGSVTSSSTTCSSVTSPNTTSGPVTSPSTTPSGSVKSPSTTPSGSVINPSATGGSVITSRESATEQSSVNSRLSVSTFSSSNRYSKIDYESKSRQVPYVGIQDKHDKDGPLSADVQTNVNAEACIFVRKQLEKNVSSSSTDRNGDNGVFNSNIANRSGCKPSAEESSVGGVNGRVSPSSIVGGREEGRPNSDEHNRRMAGEGRQAETSACNEETREASGGEEAKPCGKHPRDAGVLAARNEKSLDANGKEIAVKQERTPEHKIVHSRQNCPQKSGSNHTVSTKCTNGNNVIPTASDNSTLQQNSQPLGNELDSSKAVTARLHQQGMPHQHDNRPAQQQHQPNPSHQHHHPSRPHGTSQQKASSAHQIKNPAIGIDLGTWKCCVGVVRDGKVEIIENERGNKITPSYVAFTETERLVGEDAQDQVALNPTNTVFGVKRIIGRKFDDQSILLDMKFWPFTVSPDEDERPRIPVQYRRQKNVLSAELVSAMMLEKMKRIAESHLGCEVRDAVISVPAYFNNSQRQATKDAGTIAGLNVLGLINEPTAAALAYRDNRTRVEPHNVLIFDLGGGTFDVAVIRVDESGLKVEGVCGDSEFGGNEMSVLLMQRFEDEIKNKYGKHVFHDKKGMERLRTASEKAKKALTLLPKANVQVDSLIGDIDFNTSIKRHDFEQLYYSDVKQRIEAVLKNVLQQVAIQPPDIDEVVLVGGTSRIPKIQNILTEFFGGKVLNKTVNPDEAVAHGAALHAAFLARDNEVKEVHVAELVQIPAESQLGGPATSFKMYRKIPPDNELLITKCCVGTEIQQTTANDSRTTQLIEDSVTYNFRLDAFGVFQGHSQSGKSPRNIKRVPIAECLTETEVTQLAALVRQFAQDDQELKEGVAAMSDLEALCFQTKALVVISNSLRRKLEPDELRGIAAHCEEMICWLDANDSATKAEYQCMKRELCGKILAVVEKKHVKVENLVGRDQEWFREICNNQPRVKDEKNQRNTFFEPLCETSTHVNQNQPNPSQLSMQPPPELDNQDKPDMSQQSMHAQPLMTNEDQHKKSQQPTQPHANAHANREQSKLFRLNADTPLQEPAGGASSQTRASELRKTTFHSVEDYHHLTQEDSTGRLASQSEDTRLFSLQNDLKSAVVSSQPNENVLKPPPLENLSFTSGHSQTRPPELDSLVFSAPSKRYYLKNPHTPNTEQDVDSLILRSPDSGIYSPQVSQQRPSLSDAPLSTARPEHISSEYAKPPSSDSGISSPRSPDLSARTNFFDASRTLLTCISQSTSLPSRSGSESMNSEAKPQELVEKMSDVLGTAQERLKASPCMSTEPNSSNIGAGIEPTTDKARESSEQPVWLGAYNNAGSWEAEIEKKLDALERDEFKPAQASCVERQSIGPSSVESFGIRNSSISSFNSETDFCIADHKHENQDHMIASFLNGRHSSPMHSCDIAKVHRQVPKPPSTPLSPGYTPKRPAPVSVRGPPHPYKTVPEPLQLHGDSDLSTKTKGIYSEMESTYSDACSKENYNHQHLCFENNKQRLQFDSRLDQYVIDFSRDPLTGAHISMYTQFGSDCEKRDSPEAIKSTLSQQMSGKLNDAREDPLNDQNSSTTSSSLPGHSVAELFATPHQATTTFHNECEISSHGLKLKLTSSGSGVLERQRRNQLQPCSLSYNPSPPAEPSSSSEEQPRNAIVLQRPAFLSPQERSFRPHTVIENLERDRSYSASGGGHDEEQPPPGMVRSLVLKFTGWYKQKTALSNPRP